MPVIIVDSGERRRREKYPRDWQRNSFRGMFALVTRERLECPGLVIPDGRGGSTLFADVSQASRFALSNSHCHVAADTLAN